MIAVSTWTPVADVLTSFKALAYASLDPNTPKAAADRLQRKKKRLAVWPLPTSPKHTETSRISRLVSPTASLAASVGGDDAASYNDNDNDDDDALAAFCRSYERALAQRQRRLATSRSQKGVDKINGEFWRAHGPECSIEQRIKPTDFKAAWVQGM